MLHRYAATASASPTQPAFLVAGSGGLTVTRVDVTDAASESRGFEINRATVVGGSPMAIEALDNPAPPAQATAVGGVTTQVSKGALLGGWAATGSADMTLVDDETGPVGLASGEALAFQVGSANVQFIIHFEEPISAAAVT